MVNSHYPSQFEAITAAKIAAPTAMIVNRMRSTLACSLSNRALESTCACAKYSIAVSTLATRSGRSSLSLDAMKYLLYS